MANTDVFALRDTGLDAFVFAEIGTELNGSMLTILSALARLGQDPWAEAARWANGPRAVAIDRLSASIVRMPLGAPALAEARATAARLLELLPSPALGSSRIQTRAAPPARWDRRRWTLALMLVACGGLAAVTVAQIAHQPHGLASLVPPMITAGPVR